MTRVKKIVLIVVACILFIGAVCSILTRKYLKTWDISYSFKLIKCIVIEDPDYYLLKKGYYCGEGGSNCNHWVGYIYYTDDFTAEQAMEKAGYYDIGHVYNDGEKTHKEYCTNEAGEHTIIRKVSHFLNGYLLEYHVIGIG